MEPNSFKIMHVLFSVLHSAPMPPDSDKYYGFSQFAIELNELKESESSFLPRTDSRFRPDQRYFSSSPQVFLHTLNVGTLSLLHVAAVSVCEMFVLHYSHCRLLENGNIKEAEAEKLRVEQVMAVMQCVLLLCLLSLCVLDFFVVL